MKHNTHYQCVAALMLSALVAALLASCGRKALATGAAMQMSRNFKMAAPRAMEMAADAAPIEAYDAVAMDSESAVFDGSSGENSNSVSAERKLIHTANLTVSVTNIAEAETAADDLCRSLGGYVASSNRSDEALSMDMKVNAARFDEAVASVSAMGKLVSRNISAQDVTDRYYDLESRIGTKRILKERLESYLKSSANMKDLVAVETQLNSVISDLESMQGQFKRLSNQIDYATITVRFTLPTGKTERGWKWPSVTGKVRAFIVGAAGFFTTLILVIVGIALFGTPVVLLAALLYYLTFGKVGWIRRLFRKLRE